MFKVYNSAIHHLYIACVCSPPKVESLSLILLMCWWVHEMNSTKPLHMRPATEPRRAAPPTPNIWACKETIVTWWLKPLICYSKWGMKYNTLYIVYTKWFLYWNNKAIFNLLTQYLQCFIIRLSWLTLSFWSGAVGVIFWTWWIRGFFFDHHSILSFVLDLQDFGVK